jgi:uncharacterized protein
MSGDPPQDQEPPLEAQKPRLCPICGKPATLEVLPFCSKRCADVDLYRWLGGTYAIPVAEDLDKTDDGSDGDA